MSVVDRLQSSYLPRLAAQRLATGPLAAPEATTAPAALLATDIVGFTRHVERLTTSGPEGLDELAGALDAYVRALVAVVDGHGGDVLNVAGDAFLCAWMAEDGDLATATMLAGQAALGILEAVRSLSGEPRFSTRIGIAAGEVTTAFVGGWGGDWKLVATGAPVTEAAQAEQSAPVDGVLLASAAAALVADRCVLDPAADRAVLTAVHAPVVPTASPDRPLVDDALLGPMLPAPVRYRSTAEDVAWLAELRRVTVVMAGLTRLDHVERAPLDVGHEAIGAFQAAVDRYEGWSHVALDGKGVTALAVYGLPPRAHEDDAVRAVLTGQQVARDLAALGLSFGIGVARGRAFCGAFGSDVRREYTASGDVMNLAARLMTTAHDEVLVDDVAAAAVRGRFELEQRSPIVVKGRATPVRPAVPGAAISGRAGATGTVIGRRTELRVLDDLVACAGRAGAAVVLEAEAGAGKSTLVAAAVAAAQRAGVRVGVAASSSLERATPYFAWRPVLAELVLSGAVEAAVAADPGIERLLPLLGGVVTDAPPETAFTAPMQGEVRADNTRRVLTAVVRASALTAPTLFVVEDAHWLDSSSWSLLASLVAELPQLAVLVATRTISDEPPEELAALLARPRTEHLTLGPLGAEEIEALIADRLGVVSVPATLTDLVLDRTAGNPFFCVELVQTMREGGTLRVDRGVCELGDLDGVDVPSTVEGVVVSRLDRLRAEQGTTLKVAAVVGRTFATAAVVAAHPRADQRQVDHDLAELARLGLTEPDGDGTYRFGHDITREVTYGLLTQVQRRPLHLAVADWYETAHADLEPHVAVLAEHCWRAGATERAVEYLDRAGRQALRSGAFGECMRFFERAIEAGGDADPVRRAIWTKGLGTAHYFLGDLAASRRKHEEAVAAIDRPVPVGKAAVGRGVLAHVVRQGAHRIRPDRYGGRRADEATRVETAVECYRTLGQIYYLDGEPPELLIYLTLAGLNVGEEAGPSPSLARVLINAAVAASLVNLDSLAESYAQRAIAMAESGGQHDASSYVWSIYSILLCNRGQWEAARQANDTAYKQVFEIGDRNLEAEVWQVRAALEICAGNLPAAEGAWAHTRELGLRAGNDQMYCWSLLDEVQTCLARGRFADAAAVLEGALAIPTAPNDGSTEIEKAYCMAATRLRQGEHEEAAAGAARAVEMVAAQLPAAYPWPDFCAGAIEVQLAIAASGSPFGRRHRDELLGAAARGARLVKKVARPFRGVRSRRWLLDGLVAAECGRRDRAVRAFTRAEEVAVAMDLPYDLARARLERARASEPSPARDADLAAATAAFESMGALALLDEATGLR